MPCGTWTTTDVPDSELGFVIALYKADKATKIDTRREPDGEWTVIATFPPCDTGDQGSEHDFATLKTAVSVVNVQDRGTA